METFVDYASRRGDDGGHVAIIDIIPSWPLVICLFLLAWIMLRKNNNDVVVNIDRIFIEVDNPLGTSSFAETNSSSDRSSGRPPTVGSELTIGSDSAVD